MFLYEEKIYILNTLYFIFSFFYSNNIFKDSTLLKSSSDYIKYQSFSKEDFFQEYLGKWNKYKLPSEDRERGKAIGAFEGLDYLYRIIYRLNILTQDLRMVLPFSISE